MRRIALLSLLLFVAQSPFSAAAQIFYKSTMPDGRVIYGDKPAPGAAKVEETKPDISKGGIGGTMQREAEALKELEKARLKREGGDGLVSAAEQALRDAEAARAAGKEPLASERLGTAGGSSRITDAYYARQKKLEEEVEKARRNLDQARSGK